MMKTETKKTLLRVHVFSKKARTRRLKSKSILVTRAVSSSSSSFQEEEDDYLEDEDEDNEYYSFDDDEDFERAQERERVEQRTSDRQRARLATGFGKGRKNASSSTSSSSSLSSSRENEQKLAALIDGGEAFFLSAAVAMKARQVYVEQRARAENENASVASSSGGALMDLPLYLAVVVGAVLRRASTSASGSGMFSSVFSSKSDKVKFPRAVNARVQNLEVGLERLDENQRRYSRDVSRLGTRVRLTRRELSPMIRRAEATSITFGEVAAELAKRIEVAEEEGSKLAETMASLHAVSAKQFEVLSKSVRELRAAMKELEMEAEEAAMMTSEEIAFSKKTNGIINSSRFAKKEELEKLERMLTEALEEMEDCLTTMVREKALALGEEIDDISLMKDDLDDVNGDEEREEEKNKELVWVGESSAQKKKSALLESKSQNAGKSADDDEKKIAAENEPPTIQLYKFDEFDSSSSSRSSNSSSSSTDDESGTRRDVSDE